MKKMTFLQLCAIVLVSLGGNLVLSSAASAANTYTNITSTSVTVNFVTNSSGGDSSYGGTADTWFCQIENAAGNVVIQEHDGIAANLHTVNVTGLSPGTTYTVRCADSSTTGYQHDQISTFTTLTQISHSSISGLTAPSIFGTPVTSITSDSQFTGTVSWAGATSSGLFAQATTYTATVTLTPVAGYTATGLASNFFSVAGATSVSITSNGGTGNSTIQVAFPATPYLVTVTALTPTSGYFGQLETITGTNLDRATYVAVYFLLPTPAEHDVPSSAFISQSATSITFRLPAINSFATTGSAGSISGNVSAPSGGTFTVAPANLSSGDSFTNLTLIVSSVPSPTIISPTNNQTITGTVGTPLNFSFSLSGTSPFTVTAGGALPAGLSMTSAGVISGTPTVVGTTTLTFTAQDALGGPATGVSGVSFVISAASNTPAIVPIPDPVQQSKIIGLEGPSTLIPNTNSVVIDGLFVEKIKNISIGGVMLPQGSWTQTSSKITVALPTLKSGPLEIQIYNGSAPVLPPVDPMVVTQASAHPQTSVKSKVTYIKCGKGSHIRIAFGVNPVCPVGYSIK